MREIPNYRWSYSSIGLIECPKKYELIRAKEILKSPKSSAGDEGARLHELIEGYIRDDVWSVELSNWKRVLDIYKAKNGVCEVGYGFKLVEYNPNTHGVLPDVSRAKNGKLWIPIQCSDSDPDRWFTCYIDWMKIDGNNCEIVDWKTGKVKVTKQLQLYAWVVMTAHPEIEKVKVTFHWLNHKDQVVDTFERKDLRRLFEYYEDKLDDVDNCYRSDIWPEIPGNIDKKTGRGVHCRFCPATTEHCSYGIEKEKL